VQLGSTAQARRSRFSTASGRTMSTSPRRISVAYRARLRETQNSSSSANSGVADAPPEYLEHSGPERVELHAVHHRQTGNRARLGLQREHVGLPDRVERSHAVDREARLQRAPPASSNGP
jgi:hypothetical protein